MKNAGTLRINGEDRIVGQYRVFDRRRGRWRMFDDRLIQREGDIVTYIADHASEVRQHRHGRAFNSWRFRVSFALEQF